MRIPDAVEAVEAVEAGNGKVGRDRGGWELQVAFSIFPMLGCVCLFLFGRAAVVESPPSLDGDLLLHILVIVVVALLFKLPSSCSKYASRRDKLVNSSGTCPSCCARCISIYSIASRRRALLFVLCCDSTYCSLGVSSINSISSVLEDRSSSACWDSNRHFSL